MACPFCQNQIKGNPVDAYEVTMQQIVRMYEHFEKAGQNLMLARAETKEEQHFFEDFYGQVTYLSAL